MTPKQIENLTKILIEQKKENIKNELQFLLTHNKNYTKKQYYELIELEENIKDLFELLED